MFTHPHHPANKQTGEVGDEEIETQRVDLPGGANHRPVAGGDVELRSGGGLPVVGGEDALNQMPERTASLRNTTNAPFVADERYQMPNTKAETSSQMPYTTNATSESLEDVDFSGVAFAEPTGWGKLWRIERNGNYYIYRLRFVDSAETPKEYQRITWRGGKITPQIEAKFKQRKGRGRHADSRTDADRFRGRAFDLAKRIRSSR